MNRDDKKYQLTELEGAVLGAVQRDGPCTPYSIKVLFRKSPSEFWSGSAGAIYPLMRRLEQRGLLASERASTGKRGHRNYRATALGKRAFTRWMTDSEQAVGMGYDPLRTRLVFLKQLTPGARANFIATVSAALDELPTLLEMNDDDFLRLHKAWCTARRRVFARFVAGFDNRD